MRHSLLLVAVGCWPLAGCSGVDTDDAARSTSSQAAGAADGETIPAGAIVEELRRRYVVRPLLARGGSAPANGAATSAAPSAPQPLLGPALSGRLVSANGRLEASWTADSNVDVWVPRRASDAFGLRDRTSGISVEARLVGARPAMAGVADGLAVYDGAGPTGGSVLHRLIDGGTEDYVTFESEPATPELAYDVSLSGVAGLRLVDNTLELVDASSVPRFRISPPYVVGARGEVAEAVLSVSGCAVDGDPAAPWDRPPLPPGSDRCRVSVRWQPDAVSYPAIVDPAWSSTASMASARAGHVGFALSNNRVLVAGGLGSTFLPLRSAEVYDPTTRTWAATGSMAVPRSLHAAALRGNGHVLVAGGNGAAGAPLASTETYNPSTGTWTTQQAMNKPRAQHRLTTLSNGDVLASGGNVDGTADAQRFSNVTGAWSGAGTMLTGVGQHSATLLGDGRVLVLGNQDPSSQLFQPSTNSWSVTANAPERRGLHTAIRLSNNQVLVAGGMDGSTGLACDIFNPSTGRWSPTGSLWQPHRVGATAALLSDGRVLLVGGDTAGSNRTASEIYDPVWGTWRPGPLLTGAPQDAISARLQNNRVLVAGGTVGGAVVASARELDPTTRATSAVEYKFSASIDPAIRPDLPTELWAALYRPTTLPPGRMPVVVFLHGEHYTCGTGSNPRRDETYDYSLTGTCPAGYVVTPNHRGYAYIANELASRGYLVVSINSNRGINGAIEPSPGDPGLASTRGALVLKHLQRLSEWNRGVSATPSSIGVSLQNKLDLSQVGLMGHSRGAGGVRGAYNLYRESGSPWPARIVDTVNFRGIFEIGAALSQSAHSARSTAHASLLPMCSGDAETLPGIGVFDAMMMMSQAESNPTPKATYTVWGANHNYYNTEWQESDASEAGCRGHRAVFSSAPGVTGSAEQRQTGFQAMLAFFVANVGNGNAPTEPWYRNLFNPEASWSFSPPVDRGYTPALGSAYSRVLEDFLGDTGTGSDGLPNIHWGLTLAHGPIPEHDTQLRGGDIAWSWLGAFFQTQFQPVDLRSYQMLDLRVDRADDPSRNTTPSTNFQVQLVNADHSVSSALWVGDHLGGASLTGPVGGPIGPHIMLQTARIPLAAFSSATLSGIRGVRLTFAAEPTGHIYVANIRASRSSLVP
jgi:hypothetical protein